MGAGCEEGVKAPVAWTEQAEEAEEGVLGRVS